MAIIITVLVLKLQQPAEPTINAILSQNTIYVTYFISFFTIFMIWYDNHNLFQSVNELNNKLVLIYALQIFTISLFPYFSIWVATDIESIASETMFWLVFLSITILYILSINEIHKSNPELKNTNHETNLKYIPITINIIGFIITYTVWVPGIYVCCLISLIIWFFVSDHHIIEIESKERFEALIDAIIAIILTVIVLKIPVVSNGSWQAFFDLKLEFLAYIASFTVCFSFWNFTNNLFDTINKIDYKVIWAMGLLLFVLSLLPHLTTFVGQNFDSFLANLLYGLNFIIINLISIYGMKSLQKLDMNNETLNKTLKNYNAYIISTLVVIFGIIIGYFTYPQIIIIASLISIAVIWIFSGKRGLVKF